MVAPGGWIDYDEDGRSAGAPGREVHMIDSVLNLLFRCSHRRLTRPMAPVSRAGKPHSQAYVVCLDCGKQFEYDVNTMHMGKAIAHSHESAVVPPPPGHSKLKLAMLAA